MSEPEISLSFVEFSHPIEHNIHVSQDDRQKRMNIQLFIVKLLLLKTDSFKQQK